MASEKMLREKKKVLELSLKPMKKIAFSCGSSRQALLQGALSLGDERLGMVLYEAFNKNVTWKNALLDAGFEAGAMLFMERELETELPWEFMDHGISKEQLWQRYLAYKKARKID